MRLISCLLFLYYFLINSAALAFDQDNIQAGGYFESTTLGDYRKDKKLFPILQNFRTRLNLNASGGEMVEVGISIIGNLYTGATTFELFDFLSQRERNTIPAFAQPYLIHTMQNQLWLQEAFGMFFAGPLKFCAGRQKIYLGTGYAFNPIDLINRKDPLNPGYEVEGTDAIMGSLTFLEDNELEITYFFGTSHQRSRDFQRVEDGDWMLRLKTHQDLWDISLLYVAATIQRQDLQSVLANKIAPENVLGQTRWHLAGGSFSGEILQVGLHGEGGYVWAEKNRGQYNLEGAEKNHFRFLVGADYTFEFQLELMAEYQFDGESRGGEYSLNSRLNQLAGERATLGRHTLFAGLRYPLTDLLSFQLYAIITPKDPSATINPWLVWEAGEGLTASVTASIPIGDENSVNGNLGAGGFARLRFSF